MDSEFLGTHSKWQLSISEEKFGRDTQKIEVGWKDSAESLGRDLGGREHKRPSKAAWHFFLESSEVPCSSCILHILHAVNPALLSRHVT